MKNWCFKKAFLLWNACHNENMMLACSSTKVLKKQWEIQSYMKIVLWAMKKFKNLNDFIEVLKDKVKPYKNNSTWFWKLLLTWIFSVVEESGKEACNYTTSDGRSTLGLSLLDHFGNDELRRRSGAKKILHEMKRKSFSGLDMSFDCKATDGRGNWHGGIRGASNDRQDNL